MWPICYKLSCFTPSNADPDAARHLSTCLSVISFTAWAVALAESGIQCFKIPLLFCGRTGCGVVPLQGEGAGSGSCSHWPRAAPMSMLAFGGVGMGAAQLQLCFCTLWNESIKLKWVWKPLSQPLLHLWCGINSLTYSKMYHYSCSDSMCWYCHKVRSNSLSADPQLSSTHFSWLQGHHCFPWANCLVYKGKKQLSSTQRCTIRTWLNHTGCWEANYYTMMFKKPE